MQLSGDHPRDIKDVLNQLGLRLGVSFNCLQSTSGGRLVQFAVAQHMGPPDDGIQWRPQLVRDGREELVFQGAGVLGGGARGLFAFQ